MPSQCLLPKVALEGLRVWRMLGSSLLCDVFSDGMQWSQMHMRDNFSMSHPRHWNVVKTMLFLMLIFVFWWKMTKSVPWRVNGILWNVSRNHCNLPSKESIIIFNCRIGVCVLTIHSSSHHNERKWSITFHWLCRDNVANNSTVFSFKIRVSNWLIA